MISEMKEEEHRFQICRIREKQISIFAPVRCENNFFNKVIYCLRAHNIIKISQKISAESLRYH